MKAKEYYIKFINDAHVRHNSDVEAAFYTGYMTALTEASDLANANLTLFHKALLKECKEIHGDMVIKHGGPVYNPIGN